MSGLQWLEFMHSCMTLYENKKFDICLVAIKVDLHELLHVCISV